eukprot:scaffold9851_cov100-Isochrysis_galbana.AAC.9
MDAQDSTPNTPNEMQRIRKCARPSLFRVWQPQPPPPARLCPHPPPHPPLSFCFRRRWITSSTTCATRKASRWWSATTRPSPCPSRPSSQPSTEICTRTPTAQGGTSSR